MNIEERVDFYKKSILFEKEITRIADNSVHELKGTIFYGLIYGIAMDSNKHIHLLEVVLRLISEPKRVIEKTKYLELLNNVQEHLELEKKAIKTYKTIIDAAGPLIEQEELTIIKMIYEDELKHHKILEKIIGIINEYTN
ncbi:MAG: hypothetical protein FK731_09925 [Asgard group archaeon]|nr:hypothetical protein [Asgard group archaeon]